MQPLSFLFDFNSDGTAVEAVNISVSCLFVASYFEIVVFSACKTALVCFYGIGFVVAYLGVFAVFLG